MPTWSTNIARRLLRLATANGYNLNQSQLQKLVYIAHGWRLALTGEPLTGDRPEAWSFGPVYRRLADALAPFGNDALPPDAFGLESGQRGDLNRAECDLVEIVYSEYGHLNSAELAAWTRKGNATWPRVFANGRGEFHDVSHLEIGAQFMELAQLAREVGAL